ncbi:phage fiber-tail adaptor protein [Campylobacter coli]
MAQVRLSGGTVGTTYSVACRITTNTGQIDERTFRVLVQER